VLEEARATLEDEHTGRSRLKIGMVHNPFGADLRVDFVAVPWSRWFFVSIPLSLGTVLRSNCAIRSIAGAPVPERAVYHVLLAPDIADVV